MVNPFSHPSLLDMPLSTEQCQLIHFEAVKRVLQNHPCDTQAPDSVDVEWLRHQAHLFGREVCLIHPNYIDEIFRGVTTDVYRTIQDLYCDRLGRSPAMVTQILTALANHACVEPIHAEALWAIFSYLAHLRRKKVAISCEVATAGWVVGALPFDISLQDRTGTEFTPIVICVVEAQTGNILTFRVSQDRDLSQATLLAVFDALAAQREVGKAETGGLVWRIPARILGVPTDTLPLMQKALAQLPVDLSGGDTVPAIPGSTWSSIQGQWHRELRHRQLTVGQFRMFFDQRLFRLQGFGPERNRKERSVSLARYRGFSRDPGEAFPALRDLLPVHESCICLGSVPLDGLHYYNDLLHLWPGRSVRIRRSEEAESRAWIYFGDDVVCEANAIELKRFDGTYRPWRTGG